MVRQWLQILFLVSLSCSVVRAGTIYVNNTTGDDRAHGRSPEILGRFDGPLVTIGRALQIAYASDTIEIANTGYPYRESIIVDRPALSGKAAFPFIIEGNGAVVQGSVPLPARVWSFVGQGTFRYQPYRRGHYQLVLNGTPANELRVPRTALERPALQPLQWCAFQGWVYFRVEPGRYVDQYQLGAPRFDVGLGLHNVRHVVVRNLRIEQFRLDGIHVSGYSRDIRLENIASSGNGRAGLALTGAARATITQLELKANRIVQRLELVNGRIYELPAPPMRDSTSSNAFSREGN